jgi:hypothetical protein
MALCHMLGNRQPQTGAASFTRAAAVHAVKALGQSTKVLSGNTRTSVRHRKNQAPVFAQTRDHRDVPTCRRITHGVADQITHGAEQFTGCTSQIAVKPTLKLKLVIGVIGRPHDLR